MINSAAIYVLYALKLLNTYISQQKYQGKCDIATVQVHSELCEANVAQYLCLVHLQLFHDKMKSTFIVKLELSFLLVLSLQT